jgi:hypothetical protein
MISIPISLQNARAILSLASGNWPGADGRLKPSPESNDKEKLGRWMIASGISM